MYPKQMYFIGPSVFAATQSRISSLCQIVVRETENRQVLGFFSLVIGICGSLMRSNGRRRLGSRGALSLRFLQEPALSLSKGRVETLLT
jgi:hypothetical protein